MSYQVLARKYRPQRLDEVVGQDHVSKTLKNALKEDRVAHAYLFSGPRGVGKTTMARILAKALNCKDPIANEPCGKCSNCVEITSGSNMDVQEIDAASNRGIDDVRTLRENVKFAPASSKYKVYIIDEAHQITNEGFNALLKTLEEPPKHVVFVMATTEQHKMPVTILSRCQRYRFRFLSTDEIAEYLKKIILSENLKIDDAAVKVITIASGGSMRDALSLLDQAVSTSIEKVTSSDIKNLLGFLPKEIISSVAECLAKEDQRGLMEAVRSITEEGYNILQFARDLRDHLRDILIFKVSPGIISVVDEELEILKKQKELFSEAWLIRAGQLISKALEEMRWHDNPRIIAELCLLRMAQPYLNAKELMDRLDRLEEKADSLKPEDVNVPSSPEPEIRKSKKQDIGFSEKEKHSFGQNSIAEVPGDTVYSGAEMNEKIWREFVLETQGIRPLLGNYLSNSRLKEVNGNIIVIAIHNKFDESGIKFDLPYIEEALKKKTGAQFQIKLVMEKSAPMEETNASGSNEIIVSNETVSFSGNSFYEVKEEPPVNTVPAGLEKILQKFPGKVTKKGITKTDE